MLISRRQGLVGLAALAGPVALPTQSMAQNRAETLRQVTGAAVNTLDPTMTGATRESFGLSMNVYDRLVSFERKRVGDGWVFDTTRIRPELAESFDVSADGRRITFKLRADAVWHDGTPVTAADVKWSLDRAVTSKSLAANQLATGSLTDAGQFRVLDGRTVEVTLEQGDRLALPNLCTVYAIMVNSTLAKKNATAADPWAQEWMKTNTAAGGAYTVEAYRPGEQVTLRRNEAWRGGPGGQLPYFRRVISQTVPEAATRASLVEKGDADLSIDLQASDVPSLQGRGRVKVVSTPQFNGFQMIAFNNRVAPFDNIKVRQAIAAALPYDDMFQAALFARGAKLYGGEWSGEPAESRYPQPMPLRTDLAEARRLLADAGMPNGFSTTFSFNVGSAAITEPMAALLKESLAKIGITVQLDKLPDAQMSTAIAEKKLPFYTEYGIAWLPSTDYFFRNFFQGESRWNYSAWNNPEIVAVSQRARFEQDPAAYDKLAKRLVAIQAAEVPLVMLWQPNQDAVMVPGLDGYTYWFHRQVDFRDLRRA